MRGYTSGIDCCDFGQANAAVFGFTARGKPALLTSRGPLALSDGFLRVGCPACIRVLDAASGKLVASYPSPSWALILTGHKETDLFLADTGELFVRQPNSCVQVFPNAMFKPVADIRCTGKPPRNLRLTIETGACT